MTDSSDLRRPLDDGPNGQRPVAIVTGAAKRIGRHVVLELAKSLQLDVVIHYGRSADAAAEVADEVKGMGRRCVTVSADLADPDVAAKAVFEASGELGPVTVLVNCAAIFEECELPDVDIDHCQRHIAINTLAPVFLSQAFQRQLADDQAGHIINLLDWRATKPPATHLVYTASKAALAGLTKTMAQQLAPAIQVNGIAPGAILPPPGKKDWHDKRVKETVPLQRPGGPQDICDAAVYLLKSSFVTGEILHVAGGEQM